MSALRPRAAPRCTASTGEVDHEAPRVFGSVAYAACRKPAAWFIDGDLDLPLCEHHAVEALLYEGRQVDDANGEPMAVPT